MRIKEEIMPRYVRQRDLISCGPLAILNALKWAGIRATVGRDYKRLRRLTGVTASYGTTSFDMDRVLFKTRGLMVRRARKNTMRELQKHLEKGGAVVAVCHSHFRPKFGKEGHALFIIGMTRSKKSFKVVNGYQGRTNMLMRRSIFVDNMRESHEYNWHVPRFWLISKKL